MNSVVMWIGAVLAAVLAALFAVPMFIDWNGYRGVFEEEASRILGRNVRVGGSVNLRLLPSPYLRFEKLRIADATGGTGEPLFRAETFTVWLSVPPLLRGDVEVRHMALERPVVNLALDGDGVGNWTSLSVRTARLPFVPHNVALHSVDISGGSAVLRGASAGEIARLDAVDGELAAEALDGPFRFTGTATWDDAPRELRIAAGKVSADGELRFKASARTKGADGVTAQLDGSILDVAGKARMQGALAMKVPLPELPAAASVVAGVEVPVASPAAASPQVAPGPQRTTETQGNQAPHDGPAGSPAAGGNPAPASSVEKAAEPAAAKPRKAEGPVTLDVKGRVAIDALRLEASELVASIENVGQPQLVTGGAVLRWGEPARLDFNIASHWLDLDRLAPSSGRASPVATLATMARGLAGVLPAAAGVQGSVSVEQLSLGGEAVGGLDVAIAREKDGPVVIERFLAALPAGARIGLDGRLVAGAGDLDLDGRVTVAGPSLERLAKWAAAGSPTGAMAPEGTFALDAGLAISRDSVRFTDVRGKLSGHAMTGSVTLPLTSAVPLAVAVEADTIESSWLWNGGLSRSGAMGFLERLSSWRETETSAGAAPGNRDISVRLRAGELHGPDRTLEDVEVNLAVRTGVMSLERLAFRDGDTVTVDVSGRLATSADAADGGGPGYLSGHVSAASASAFNDLVDMLELEQGDRTRRIAALAPVRFAGTAKLGQRAAGSLDARIDGVLGGGRVTLGVGLDRVPRFARSKRGGAVDTSDPSWHEAPAEITIAASDAPVDDLLALLTGRSLPASGSGSRAAPLRANAALKAVGVPASGMIVDSAITGSGLSLAYNGTARLDASGAPDLTGTLEVAADRLGDVLAITGLSGSGNGLDQALTGTLGLASERDGTLKLTPSGLTIAGARIDGMLRVARAEQGRTRLAGEIAVDRATIPGMLASLSGGVPVPLPASAAAGDRAGMDKVARVVWSERPFAADAFQRLEGGVNVKFARLALASGLTLTEARMSMGFAPGRIVAKLEEAHGLGGAVVGELTLDKAAAGVRASGKIAANGVALAQIAQNVGAGAAEGVATASLSFSGQALSASALVRSLEGSGTVTLGPAEIAGFSPDAVRSTAETAFTRGFTINEASLLAVLSERLRKGKLGIGPRQIAIALDDGALKLERFAVTAPGGRVETLVTVDLATLDAETEWRITAAGDAPGRPDWPQLGVFYTGPLAAVATIEPRLALGNFERELTVRRMEREVEELERLRRLDEERAKAERERQQALEAERQRLIEAERRRKQDLLLRQQAPLPGATGASPPASQAPAPAEPQASHGAVGAPGSPVAPAAQPADQTKAADAGQPDAQGQASGAATPPEAPGNRDLVAPPPAAVPRPRAPRPARQPDAAEIFSKTWGAN
ncbi:MAG: AsmA family protein [Hyphomicrobiaceae bacterium]|nr:AsmA family protein [Hyphomicrobiaceae bacterium]